MNCIQKSPDSETIFALPQWNMVVAAEPSADIEGNLLKWGTLQEVSPSSIYSVQLSKVCKSFYLAGWNKIYTSEVGQNQPNFSKVVPSFAEHSQAAWSDYFTNCEHLTLFQSILYDQVRGSPASLDTIGVEGEAVASRWLRWERK